MPNRANSLSRWLLQIHMLLLALFFSGTHSAAQPQKESCQIVEWIENRPLLDQIPATGVNYRIGVMAELDDSSLILVVGGYLTSTHASLEALLKQALTQDSSCADLRRWIWAGELAFRRSSASTKPQLIAVNGTSGHFSDRRKLGLLEPINRVEGFFSPFTATGLMEIANTFAAIPWSQEKEHLSPILPENFRHLFDNLKNQLDGIFSEVTNHFPSGTFDRDTAIEDLSMIANKYKLAMDYKSESWYRKLAMDEQNTLRKVLDPLISSSESSEPDFSYDDFRRTYQLLSQARNSLSKAWLNFLLIFSFSVIELNPEPIKSDFLATVVRTDFKATFEKLQGIATLIIADHPEKYSQELSLLTTTLERLFNEDLCNITPNTWNEMYSGYQKVVSIMQKANQPENISLLRTSK